MSSPETHIAPDSISINVGISSADSSSQSTTPTTIFFIPGNPGLISYYYSFLPLLSQYLQSPNEPGRPDAAGNSVLKSGIRICGASLGGFEVDDREAPRNEGEKAPYGLREQIEFVERSLHNAVERSRSLGNMKPKVILMGHSVGAYIAMEILRRHREGEAKVGLDQMNLIGGVLLFPTVVDIAKSPSGRKATGIMNIPYLAVMASLLARVIVFLLPSSLLKGLVSLVMKFPPKAAVNTTVDFLRSKTGIRQAIHMAKDEMQEITSDNWSDDIWGITSPDLMNVSEKNTTIPTTPTPPPNLVFYFGRGDHWVAEQTRDDLIRSRGSLLDKAGKRNGPKMLVCEDGVLHGFCIRHNDIMARKVAGFIQEIVDGVKE